MIQPIEVDAAIVGSGQAAPALAVALAQRGERVAFIEAVQLGGSCVNVGHADQDASQERARGPHGAPRG
jgi:pyruvate/2-oxoglutarate dehydrogenase complex dihydrolipoamide dehydrogenase (E3) component